MKRHTHMHKYLFITGSVLVGLTALAVDSLQKSKKHGTDILHFAVEKRMADDGVATNASGKVQVHWNKQGKANHQDVHVNVKGLDTEATYQLAALVNDDTNLTTVTEFSTDKHGKADIELRDKGGKPQKDEA